ncbi:MAG: radical SAM protein [Candidatus Omnitrophota bacterium]|nr:radical SAM protein [Candidatus Omnitrophota bacterium]
MNVKRILFVFPNTANSPAIPNAIAMLTGIAKNLSWDVDYFDTYIYEKTRDSMEDREISGEFKPSDFSVTIEFKSFDNLLQDLQNKINTFQPNAIAISCMSFEYEFLLTFFPNLRIPDSTLVLIGGIHPILEPDKVIDSGLFDLVCIGEGEETFAEILIKFERGDDLSRVENIFFRDKRSGRVVKNSRRVLIDEKRLWDFKPDYSLFDEKYFLYPFDGELYRRHTFEIARGCPYSCSYCGNIALMEAYKGSNKFVRRRPIESIKQDMRKVIYNYNIELFYLQDECFLSHNISWLREFSEWYGREIKKPFIIQTRPETVSEEKIVLLKQMNAPFFQVSIGVESGSEKILFEVCNRKTPIKKIIDTFDLLHKHNIRTCAFFMVGFPEETRKDIFDSINLCRRIKPSVAIVSIFQPLPGQYLREVCIEKGYISGNERLQTFTGGSILKMPQISAEEIVNLRRVFLLYATLPEENFSKIEKCEKDYYRNEELYRELVSLRWNNSSIKSRKL